MSSGHPATIYLETLLKHLGVTPRGLTTLEVEHRLQQGANTLPKQGASTSVRTLFRQFQSSLVIILLIASVASFILGDRLDGFVILAAVLLNISVGYVQERRAERALEALERVAAFTATALRDGRERDVDATSIVAGDILVLHAGQKVAADARLIEAHELECNESTLTGESAPVQKTVLTLPDAVTIPEQTNMVFGGTVVTRGRGLAVVVATGIRSEIGKIATLVQTTVTEKTPLQRRLIQLSWNLTVVILLVAAVLFLFGLFRLYDVEDVFTTTVAIAVATIPEGLVIVVTVILAIGMQHMLKQRALVRSLLAAEALGSVTVIATDKTGTVTEGYMRVVRILTHNRQVAHPHRDPGEPDPSALLVLKVAALASDATIENPDRPLEEWDIRGNLTERALIRAAAEAGFTLPMLRSQYVRIGEVPFDSSRRFMATLCEHKHEGYQLFVKGAPEVLLEHAVAIDADGKEEPLTPERKRAFEHSVKEMSSQGLRALAVGVRRIHGAPHLPLTDAEAISKLVLVGVVGIQDPLRADAAETIATLHRAGIRVVMLTGDNLATARTIAAGLGLPTGDHEIMDGRELESLNVDALQQRVANIHVFARVSPKDKLRIVDALQARGEVVAMTGDGVNDAPALKAADVGVALGSGTDVAKEASDLVLLDNSLSTIAKAVFEGRVIYRNIKRVILYLLAASFSELVIVAAALFLNWPLPLTAVQILWLNIINDTLPTIALAREPVDEGILDEPPIRPSRPLLGPFTKFMAVVLSLVVGGFGIGLFALGWQNGAALDYARSLTFAFVATSSLFYMFSTRTLRKPMTSASPFSNPTLLWALGGSLVLQLLVLYTPIGQRLFGLVSLGASDWLLVVLCSLATVAFMEVSKIWFRRHQVAGA
ncbi:MAG: HAD-IC family P-type ATPase [Patescibacteria group bacterium]